jgi:protein-glutamine gamma-glutamyltransferase
VSTRPAGLSSGFGYLLFGWMAAYGLLRLTGATTVAILLAAAVVHAVAAIVGGWIRLRRHGAIEITAPTTVDVGKPFPLVVCARRGDLPPIHCRVVDRGTDVAAGWLQGSNTELEAVFVERGVIDDLEVITTTAGPAGIVWWRRRTRVPIASTWIAPAPAGPATTIVLERTGRDDGDAIDQHRSAAADDELDGVRRWREGDGDAAVHWPTSIRTGTLTVFEHRPTITTRWVVRADPRASNGGSEAARVRWTLQEGLRRGADVWGVVGDRPAVPLRDHDAIARWSAECIPPVIMPPGRRWRHQPREPDAVLPPTSRWWVAAASALSLLMLAKAGSASISVSVGLVAVCAVSAMVTNALAERAGRDRWLRTTMRTVVGIAAVLGIAASLRTVGGVTSVTGALAGPMPKMLGILVLMHGFECADRRSARAGLAFSFVVAAYAAAQRVDPLIGWWLLAWGGVWLMAVSRAAHPRRSGPRRVPTIRSFTIGATRAAVLAAATVALLLTVQVPAGPVSLGRPASFDSIVPIDTAGAITDTNGKTVPPGQTDPQPSRQGTQVGGYPGFSSSFDTSIRGTFTDEVVMRVRSPEPDFWRGQTFSRFDGRQWYVDDNPGRGAPGPDVAIPPADGDVSESYRVESDELVQTYYLAVDHPNVIFAAYRPTRVLIDAPVFARPDGALRSGVVMTEGAVYTVVSERQRVTEAALREQGDLRWLAVASPLDRYLQVPASTTQRTRDLATQLTFRAGSTYDAVLAIQDWIGANTRYDLDAPIPKPGADAVDDFLFESQLGFCEQIASALTIMLRTQGIAARVATGYVPGERDSVSGVWTVRSKDAHAWTEVWFPDTGWQAFDPTASVPLAGNTDAGSIGSGLATGAREAAREHGATVVRIVGVVAASLLALVLLVRLVRAVIHRRRRGRWGLLQDRWRSRSESLGIEPDCSNPELARRWTAAAPPAAAPAVELAGTLDRVAFDPSWIDDDDAFDRARALLDEMERVRR